MNDATHINSAFDSDLADLNAGIAKLGALSEQQFHDSLETFTSRDAHKIDAIIERDDELDQLEEELVQKAMQLIALRAPMGTDLRCVMVALKIASILERTGDYAKNIAKRNKVIIAEGTDRVPDIDIGGMAKIVQDMLHCVLKAYHTRNVKVAMEVRDRDIEVDQMHTKLFKDLLINMSHTPAHVTTGAHFLFIAKNIERIGDYATGIAEQICFLVTGTLPEEARPKDDKASTQR